MTYNVVIGGGITGLYSAHILQKRFPETPVLLVEAAPQLGGLLKSKSYKDNGVFDYGIHAMYETGIVEIDNYFLNLPIDWKFLTGHARDLGGAAWMDQVNYNAPYIDLRSAPDKDDCRQGLFGAMQAAASNEVNSGANAHQWLTAHFGEFIFEHYMKQAIEMRQHQPAEEIHWLAAKVQGLTRVVIDEESSVVSNYHDHNYSSRIAFPDQRTYPEDILPDKRAYYPREIGIGRVMDAIAIDLENRGVKLLTNARIIEAIKRDDVIDEAVMLHSCGKKETIAINRIICTVPLPALLMTLEKKPPQQPFIGPHQTVICNLTSSRQPNDHGVYYIYFHGHPRLHRISFPYNYSDSDTSRSGFQMCVECVYPGDASADNINDTVIAFLLRANIIEARDDINFTDSFVSKGGYPNLSVGNMNALAFYRNFLQEEKIRNVDNVGVLSKEENFFQFDLIRHAHEVLV